jgi:glutamate dehydrogenase
LLATILANQAANRLGCAGIARLTLAAEPAAACRAALLASEAFGLEAACDALDAAEAPAEARLAALLALRQLQEGAAQDLLALPPAPLTEALATLRPGIAALAALAPRENLGAGLPEAAAALAAAAPRLAAAPAVVRLAARAGVEVTGAAAAWSAVEQDFALDALRAALAAAPAPGAFGPRARATLAEDIAAAQTRLAALRLAGGAMEPARAAAVAALVRDAAAARDLAAATVAARALASLG